MVQCPATRTYYCTRETGHEGPCAGVVGSPEVVEEVGWLLETRMGGDGVGGWTTYLTRVINGVGLYDSDVSKALRFSRKEDAETMKYDITNGGLLTANEHIWV